MKNTLLQNRAFLIPYLLFLIISSAFLLTNSKGEAHLYINQYRSDFFDIFFPFYTYLGDGLTATFIVLALCFFKYRYAVLMGISNIIASTITQTLKHTVFSDQVRPKKFFEGIAELKLIPWVENYSYNSFPSGHTTTAFATFFCLALILENKLLKFLAFFFALTIGFSRVYLSQHFLNDVVAGSLIAVVTTLLTYQLVFISENLRNNSWLEKSVLRK